MKARKTKIFGLNIGLDPKVLIIGLIAATLALIWFNMRSGDDEHPVVSAVRAQPGTVTPAPARSANLIRRSGNQPLERGTLRLKPVDPSRGDVDPTLNLSLLERLRAVKPVEGGRNLFEGTGIPGDLPAVPTDFKKMMPGPQPPAPPVIQVQNQPPAMPLLNIPLRYYGFVKPGSHGDGNRGFFMNGDNILIATEGDVLEHRFLVVALSPNAARVEDIQLKQGQDLVFTPEAAAQ